MAQLNEKLKAYSANSLTNPRVLGNGQREINSRITGFSGLEPN